MNNIFNIKGNPYMNEAAYKIVQEFEEDGIYFTEMSPDEYIEACSLIYDIEAKDLVGMRTNDRISFRYIQDAADNGTLTIPVLDLKHNIQNGLHRAMWAKEQGMDTIPVLIIEKDVKFDFEYLLEGGTYVNRTNR